MSPTPIDHSLTPAERRLLLTSALEARDLSYSPYSNFRVGAALILGDGRVLKGANIENASYGAGICAERSLLSSVLVSSLSTHPNNRTSPFLSPASQTIRAMAVSSDLPESPCSPCGICRQFMREFCSLDMPVFMVWKQWDPEANPEAEADEDQRQSQPTTTTTTTTTTGKRPSGCHDQMGVVVKTLEELLPLSFGPDELAKV